jgi:hypothetical protein
MRRAHVRGAGPGQHRLRAASSLTLGVDIDMTLFDTVAALHATPGGEHVTDSSWEGLLSACGTARHDVLTRACSLENTLGVGLLPGAARVLTALAGQGVAIHVMTARDEPTAVEGARLLTELHVPVHGFSCGVREKVALAQALGICALVDDDPVVLSSATAAGLAVFALRHSHNAVVLDELGVPHAGDWPGLGRLLVPWLAERAVTRDTKPS